jgi:hypothetical protein
MIYKYVAATAAFLLFISSQLIHAQSLDWVNLGESLPSKQETTPLIEAKAGAYFSLESLPDANEFSDEDELPLPMPDGSLRIFSLSENTTMHPELAAQYPNIKSFNARAIDGSGFRGKVDISHKGIHAMIFPPSGPTLFLDPLFAGDASVYIAYAKTDFVTDKEMDCHVEAAAEAGGPKTGSDYNSCEFRTYRIAVAATGEYTIFHGGTVADGLAAINTTMNRVNAIYERDFSVTMTLVANNDDLIYTNPSTDPYTNGQTFTMINQNQVNVNSVIGSSNYDIGHVFGTNSGGLAGLGVTCNNNSKARGVSGSFAPITLLTFTWF